MIPIIAASSLTVARVAATTLFAGASWTFGSWLTTKAIRRFDKTSYPTNAPLTVEQKARAMKLQALDACSALRNIPVQEMMADPDLKRFMDTVDRLYRQPADAIPIKPAAKAA